MLNLNPLRGFWVKAEGLSPPASIGVQMFEGTGARHQLGDEPIVDLVRAGEAQERAGSDFLALRALDRDHVPRALRILSRNLEGCLAVRGDCETVLGELHLSSPGLLTFR